MRSMYDERLGVPLRWWALATMFLASVLLAFLVATPLWLALLTTGALTLAAVARVDGAGRVDDRQAVAGGQPGPRVHQADVPLGECERDAGRHQGPLPRRERHVDAGHQVGAGVAGVGVRRGREVAIEAEQGDTDVTTVTPGSVSGGHVGDPTAGLVGTC